MDKRAEKGYSPKVKELYTWIRKHGIASKSDLLAHMALPSSTLTRLLDEMLTDGLLEEAGFGESSGGRRPLLYRTSPSYAYVLGLDISRTRSRLLLADLHLRPIRSRSWEMTETTSPEVLLGEVVEAIRDMLAAEGMGTDRLLGLGIGAVGPVDRMAGTLLNPESFPAPGWQQVQVCNYFHEALAIPVVLDNGSNMAILAEYWNDSPLETQHMLYVRAGVGLRSSTMAGGQLVYGAFDMEDAIGCMIIQSEGRPHRSLPDLYGCLESYVSIPALEADIQSKLKQGRESVLSDWVQKPEQADFPLLLQALAVDDALVKEAFTQAATLFGIGLGNLLNTLHPQTVILGGPLVATNELFFEVCTRVALTKCRHYPHYHAQFRKEQLGESAIAIGAALQMIDSTFAP